MTPLRPLPNALAVKTLAKESRPAPPVYRPDAAIQPYTPTKKDHKVLLELKHRFIRANGDDSYYETAFNQKVEDAASMVEITAFVAKAEADSARKAAVVLPPSPPHSPVPSPRIPPQAASTPLPKPEKKLKRVPLDLSSPAPAPAAATWAAPPSSVTSAPPPSASFTASPPLGFAVSQVDRLIQKVESWNGASDTGKTVTLSPAQAVKLLNGLENILTASGNNSRFYVGFSVGESKYSNHVCIKAIAGYSPGVAQATSHKPTYHFEVQNLNSLNDTRKFQ